MTTDKRIDFVLLGINVGILLLPICVGLLLLRDKIEFINQTLVYSGAINNLALLLHIGNITILGWQSQANPYARPAARRIYKIGIGILWGITIIGGFSCLVFGVVDYLIMFADLKIEEEVIYIVCSYICFIESILMNLILVGCIKKYSIEELK